MQIFHYAGNLTEHCVVSYYLGSAAILATLFAKAAQSKKSSTCIRLTTLPNASFNSSRVDSFKDDTISLDLLSQSSTLPAIIIDKAFIMRSTLPGIEKRASIQLALSGTSIFASDCIALKSTFITGG